MRNFINFNMDPSKHQSALTLENFSALFNMLKSERFILTLII